MQIWKESTNLWQGIYGVLFDDWLVGNTFLSTSGSGMGSGNYELTIFTEVRDKWPAFLLLKYTILLLVCKKQCVVHFVPQHDRPKVTAVLKSLQVTDSSARLRHSGQSALHAHMGAQSMTKYRFLKFFKHFVLPWHVTHQKWHEWYLESTPEWPVGSVGPVGTILRHTKAVDPA